MWVILLLILSCFGGNEKKQGFLGGQIILAGGLFLNSQFFVFFNALFVTTMWRFLSLHDVGFVSIVLKRKFCSSCLRWQVWLEKNTKKSMWVGLVLGTLPVSCDGCHVVDDIHVFLGIVGRGLVTPDFKYLCSYIFLAFQCCKKPFHIFMSD